MEFSDHFTTPVDIFGIEDDEDGDVDEDAIESQNRQIGTASGTELWLSLPWQAGYFGHHQIILQPLTNQIWQSQISPLPSSSPSTSTIMSTRTLGRPPAPTFRFCALGLLDFVQ